MPLQARERKRDSSDDEVRVVVDDATRRRVGEQIAERRRGRQMSQQTLAYLARTTMNTVSEMERGVANVRFDTLDRVARVLGLELTLQEA
jgi:ribosome-binding protein aMBF1 (putative translation factor)